MADSRIIKPGTAVADVSALFNVGGKKSRGSGDGSSSNSTRGFSNPFDVEGLPPTSSAHPPAGALAGNPFLENSQKKAPKGPPPVTKPRPSIVKANVVPAVAPKAPKASSAPVTKPDPAAANEEPAAAAGPATRGNVRGKLGGKLGGFMSSLNSAIGGGPRGAGGPPRRDSSSSVGSGGGDGPASPDGRPPGVPGMGLGMLFGGSGARTPPGRKSVSVPEEGSGFDSPLNRITSPLASSMLKEKAILMRKSVRPKRLPTADHWATRKCVSAPPFPRSPPI